MDCVLHVVAKNERMERLRTRIFSGFPCGLAGKESACNVGALGSIPGLGRTLEKGKAMHSSILAWRISWILDPLEEGKATLSSILAWRIPWTTHTVHGFTRVRQS